MAELTVTNQIISLKKGVELKVSKLKNQHKRIDGVVQQNQCLKRVMRFEVDRLKEQGATLKKGDDFDTPRKLEGVQHCTN